VTSRTACVIVCRFSRNEVLLRFLSLVCLMVMFGLFLIQLDILWRAREVSSVTHFVELPVSLTNKLHLNEAP